MLLEPERSQVLLVSLRAIVLHIGAAKLYKEQSAQPFTTTRGGRPTSLPAERPPCWSATHGVLQLGDAAFEDHHLRSEREADPVS